MPRAVGVEVYYATASRIVKMKDDFWEMGDLTQCCSFKYAPTDFPELVEGTVVPQIHQKWLK